MDAELDLACLLLSGAVITDRSDRERAILLVADGGRTMLPETRDLVALAEVCEG